MFLPLTKMKEFRFIFQTFSWALLLLPGYSYSYLKIFRLPPSSYAKSQSRFISILTFSLLHLLFLHCLAHLIPPRLLPLFSQEMRASHQSLRLGCHKRDNFGTISLTDYQTVTCLCKRGQDVSVQSLTLSTHR